MAGLHKSEFENPVINWVDTRLPIFTMMSKEYGSFPTPKNFNYFWNFGALATVSLVIMILTGVFLAMNYAANTHLRQQSCIPIFTPRTMSVGLTDIFSQHTAPFLTI